MRRTAILMLALCVGAFEAAAAPLEGRWRVIRSEPAPWAVGPARSAAFDGAGLVFRADGLLGPSPLACPSGGQDELAMDVLGLFEGNIPRAEAEATARGLGLAAPGPTPTVRLTCANASFDFHRSGPDRIVFAIDGVIYTARPARSIWPPADHEFIHPARPALDCVLASPGWERIVCASPEASAAHAALAREAARTGRGSSSPASHRAFLAAASRRCNADAARSGPTADAEKAACLEQQYIDRLQRLREETARPGRGETAR